MLKAVTFMLLFAVMIGDRDRILLFDVAVACCWRSLQSSGNCRLSCEAGGNGTIVRLGLSSMIVELRMVDWERRTDGAGRLVHFHANGQAERRSGFEIVEAEVESSLGLSYHNISRFLCET